MAAPVRCENSRCIKAGEEIFRQFITLKKAPFLSNYIEEMDPKDLENAGRQVYFDLMRTIKSNLANLLCVALLAIFGT